MKKTRLNKLPFGISLGENRLHSLMDSVMLRFCESNQIFNSVISFVTVNMMNVLIGSYFSTQMLFKNKPMFTHKLSIVPNLPITFSMWSSVAFRSIMSSTFPAPVFISLWLPLRRTANGVKFSAIQFWGKNNFTTYTFSGLKFLHNFIINEGEYYVNS